MRMLNGELQNLYTFLMGLELTGKNSRMRTRFCKHVAERIQEIEAGRLEIIKKYTPLNESGEPKTKELNGNQVYDIPDDKLEPFSVELNELLVEEFVMDETDERKDMLHAVRDSILNVEMKFSGVEALRYDRWCEIFEAIK